MAKNAVKKTKKVLLFFILFIIICLLGLCFYYKYLMSPVSKESKRIELNIEDGSSAYSVGNLLLEKGLIRNTFIYKLYLKLNNVEGYKAGIYVLNKNMSLKQIVNSLLNDTKSESIIITFKEGKTIRKVAEKIEEVTGISKDEFINKLEDEDYIDSLINKYWFLTEDIKNTDIYYPLEGYLFPDTYSFNKNVTIDEIITTMLNQTDKVFSKYKNDLENSNYSINEIVTLASVIEREGIYDKDRKMISGVFYNRLNNNMSLGSDVTTYYAFKVELGERGLSSAEYNTYNPYNTRGPKMEGKLPIGAISNFGETSFEAAINPTDSNYYYFVADKSGKTHFTKDYNEHMKVIKELKSTNNWLEF